MTVLLEYVTALLEYLGLLLQGIGSKVVGLSPLPILSITIIIKLSGFKCLHSTAKPTPYLYGLLQFEMKYAHTSTSIALVR